MVTLLVLATGCASQKFATNRSNPLNPWRIHCISGRSQGLRLPRVRSCFCADTIYWSSTNAIQKFACKNLQQLAESEEGGEKIYAVSELAYIIGQRAEKSSNFSKALDMYGVSGSNAYIYLFSPQIDSQRNPYDPQFRGACDLYNGALEASLRLVAKHGSLRPGIELPDTHW